MLCHFFLSNGIMFFGLRNNHYFPGVFCQPMNYCQNFTASTMKSYKNWWGIYKISNSITKPFWPYCEFKRPRSQWAPVEEQSQQQCPKAAGSAPTPNVHLDRISTTNLVRDIVMMIEDVYIVFWNDWE